MRVTVYVLRSQRTGRLYIGQTADLDRRLAEHRGGQAPSTRGRGPWEVAGTCSFETRAEAVRFERALKRMKRPDRVLAAVSRR